MSDVRQLRRRQLKQLRASRPLIPPVDPELEISDLLLAYEIRERGRTMSQAILLARLAQSASSSSAPSPSVLQALERSSLLS
jgi:hypothetical protein